MKKFLIHFGGHEINNDYIIEGNDLLSAIQNEMKKENGYFEWAEEAEMNDVDVFNWIVRGDGGEYVNVWEIEGTIKYIGNSLCEI